MHGLFNRAIQCFVRDTYGQDVWRAIANRARLGFDGFETMLIYDNALTDQVITATTVELDRMRETVLEDIGTYLVSHPNVEAIRRLLRFGGMGYTEFLQSLEDLPDRARLALPELNMPLLDLTDLGQGRFRLRCGGHVAGIAHVIVGILRTMADDYGALVVLEHVGAEDDADIVMIDLLDQSFSSGRKFELAGQSVRP